MTIRRVKRTLADSIKKLAAEKQKFSRNPGKDNTRNRKLPFEKVVAAILSFQGQSRILCKVQNVVQIEQNLCKTGAAHAAAALFIK